jgi:hypothetical protein
MLIHEPEYSLKIHFTLPANLFAHLRYFLFILSSYLRPSAIQSATICEKPFPANLFAHLGYLLYILSSLSAFFCDTICVHLPETFSCQLVRPSGLFS